MAFTYIIPPELRVCEGSGILRYLQANKSACYYFTDAGRIQETPVLETEDLITQHSKQCKHVAGVSSPCPASPTEVTKMGLNWCCASSGFVAPWRNTGLGESTAFIVSGELVGLGRVTSFLKAVHC